MARLKGQAVAGLIVLRAGTHANGWRIAADKGTCPPVRATELLHRLDIDDACREGTRQRPDDHGW